jgi:HPt (histidine-containing phosphotransfer) domain-containing protein
MSEQEKITVMIDRDLEELIPDFLELTKKDMENIQTALDRGDYETVERLGHTTKGSGAQYGFDHLSQNGRQIEQAAKNQDEAEIRERVAETSDYLARLEIVYE